MMVAMPAGTNTVLSRVGSLVEGPAFHPYLSGRANLARLDAADLLLDVAVGGEDVEQAVDDLGANAREQRQHGNFCQLLRLVVVQRCRQGSGFHAATLALQAFERVTAEAAHFCATGRRQQLAVEVQVHARRQAVAEGDQRLPGSSCKITLLC